MRAYMLQSFISTCLLLASQIPHIACASPAIDWIRSTQNTDGSYFFTSDIATAIQSTSEVLSALAAFQENSDPGISLALDYINSGAYLIQKAQS